MLSPGSGNTVIKSKLISRRMFLISVAKAVVMVGLVGRLISLQINQATKYKSLSVKREDWKELGILADKTNRTRSSMIGRLIRFFKDNKGNGKKNGKSN